MTKLAVVTSLLLLRMGKQISHRSISANSALIVTNSSSWLSQECYKIPTIEGFVFELNNRAAHKVSNLSPVERVHVVLDLCEEPHPRVDVSVGTVCDYDMEKGLICK